MARKKAYQNLSKTPQFAEGFTMLDVIKTAFNRAPDTRPAHSLPSVKTNLKEYFSKEPSLIWFGHSSYLIHADGLNILVDPVLSGNASPFRFMIKAFPGADTYKVADMPGIDFLVLTHNHYDHLDHKALKALAPCVKKVIVPPGVSKDLKGLQFEGKIAKEMAWWDRADLGNSISIVATPARHFSGRGLIRNRSLWTSYVLFINGYKIFIGGDSGYDAHFKEIGNEYGPFDIALLECGQYNKMWPYIHSTPEEAVAEAVELKAEMVMPIHWGKFALASHGWKEPIELFITAAEKQGVRYTTPMIGEPVVLGKSYPKERWWDPAYFPQVSR